MEIMIIIIFVSIFIWRKIYLISFKGFYYKNKLREIQQVYKNYSIAIQKGYIDKIKWIHFNNNRSNKKYRNSEKIIDVKKNNLLSNKLYFKCSFSHLSFKQCDFTNTYFKNCTFFNVKFENCCFSNSQSIKARWKERYDIFNCGNVPIVFEHCKFLNTEFSDNTDMNSITFIKCKFHLNSKITSSILNFCNFIECQFYSIELKDCNLLGSNFIKNTIFHRPIKSIETIVLDELTEFDEFYISDINESYSSSNWITYKNLSYLHHIIGRKYFDLGLMEQYSKHYYWSRRYNKKGELVLQKRIIHEINDFVCGFGEKPYRTLRICSIIIVIFAFFYMYFGLNIDGVDNVKVSFINYEISLSGIIEMSDAYISGMFSNYLFFSIVTFTTVGYGNITPSGEISSILASAEMLLGVTLMGIWTATLARKMMR